ncbi:MAG: MFS transporter [Bdellovibrionota bacterium]
MLVQNKQPKGMYVLGFTEVFERMSYYTLAFLLVLYASASLEKGGLGWSKESAIYLAGFYNLAAYTLPLIGAFLADRVVGTFRAAIFGAFLIITGHLCMLFTSPEHISIFYTALSFVAVGTAFFKPCMPTLLGRLYKPNDLSREGGFKLYYMGINVGGMLAGVVGGMLLQGFGFRIALASASVGMIVGLLVLLAGRKYLVTKDFLQEQSKSLSSSNEIKKSSPIYNKALQYLALSFLFFALWATVYGIILTGTLSIYIENFTQKTVFGYDIPTTFFQSLESLGIIVFAPLLAYIFYVVAKYKKPFHFFSQMNLALFVIFCGIAYFSYLTFCAGVVPQGEKPFHWLGISLFILSLSLSEVLVNPVIMSAISLLSPAKYKTLFQSFNLAIFGITGLIAGKIGALSLKYPSQTFMSVTGVIFAGLVFFLFVRKRMVKVAIEAAEELHLEEERKTEPTIVSVIH